MKRTILDAAPFPKVYIWAFPGLGKTHVDQDGRIYDADCRAFKFVFPNGAPENLHGTGGTGYLEPNPCYPKNYLDFVDSLDAKLILLNCHISLLDGFAKDRIILVYPSETLKEEYLERYRRRGDDPSFIDYMDDNFHDMVAAIRNSPYRTYEITEPNTYLQTLLEGGVIVNQFMTKPELTKLLEESLELGTLQRTDTTMGKTPDELAQMLFEGRFHIDLEEAKNNLAAKKQSIEAARLAVERRGGLSTEELANKIMQGIVNGALGIRYTEVAPYSHGYEVTYGGGDCPGSTTKFTNRWTCYDGDLFSVPHAVAVQISKGRQSDEIFGSKCGPLDIHAVLRRIEEMEKTKITSFTPENETDFVRVTDPYRYPFRNSVATVMDVHAGKGLDGIVQHHYHGDYSTITPVKQNQLVEALVCLKGFCLDGIHDLDVAPGVRQDIIQYLKGRGIDISTPEALNQWIQANPDKCALPGNRERNSSLDRKIQSASNRVETGQTRAHEDRDHERFP